jgi:ADP-heptose:LPS heptosyltransferase
MRKILIFSDYEFIGDGILAIPAISKLRSFFPNSHITWFTGEGSCVFKGVLCDLMADNWVDEIIENVDYKSFKNIFFLPDVFKNKYYDLIVDTGRHFLSTMFLKKIPHKTLVSSAGQWIISDIKPVQKEQFPKLYTDALFSLFELASGTNVISRDYEYNIPEPYINQAKKLLYENGKKVLLAPGAGKIDKCWPLENYINLAKHLNADNISSYFILGPQELEWEGQIKKQIPNARFPLQESDCKSVYITMALAKVADLAVSNDSGVGHLLAAANKKILSLFGKTNHLRWVARGRGVEVIKANDVKDITVTEVLTKCLNYLK